MEQLEKIKNLLFKYSNLGVALNRSDALLIGKAPHIGTEAWLNRIYTPITKNDIEQIEYTIRKKIPDSYVSFLTEFSNGLNILGDTLCLFGLRYNYNRDINADWQPYSIVSLNKYERPYNSTDDMLFIGGYEWDGSLLYMTPDERIHFCGRYDSTSLCSWEDLPSMLISEIERLYTLFDSKGVEIDESRPSIPYYV